MKEIISIRDKPLAIRTYNREKINKYEITEWLLTHQSSINNIILPSMLTHFINEITSEITSETQRLQMMQSTKSQLETRLHELEKQPADVEHGGSRRRASKHSNKHSKKSKKHSNKHSNKSRKSKSRKTKTKSRRH
jgi:hypothetical protein